MLDPNTGLYTTQKEIGNWCMTYTKNCDAQRFPLLFTINENLTVDVHGPLEIEEPFHRVSNIPFQFNYCVGNLTIDSHSLESFQGIPPKVGTWVFIKTRKIDHLHNIHKYITEINGSFICLTARSHVLGLCLIKGIRSIQFEISQNGDTEKVRLGKIMTEYLHDIHLCQEALIDAGFEQYARI